MGGIAFALEQIYKPHRDAANEKAIVTTAKDIFASYNKDEKEANAKYLDKAVEITGEIAETKTNQQGKMVCILKTDDPFFGVNCTFKQNENLKVGQQVTLKGICTGYLTGADVIVIDCIFVNNN